MSVILKKDEKVQKVVESLEDEFSFDGFIETFIKMYPKDWKKININYNKHKRKNKEGQSFPMPEPKQYLKNALNVWQKKTNR